MKECVIVSAISEGLPMDVPEEQQYNPNENFLNITPEEYSVKVVLERREEEKKKKEAEEAAEKEKTTESETLT